MALRFPAGAVDTAGRSVGGQFAAAGSVARVQGRFTSPVHAPILTGPVRYQSRFPQIIAELEIRTRASSLEAAQNILADAQVRVPQPGQSRSGRATGALRDSLAIVYLEEVQDFAVASPLVYAPYVEFGTSRQPAQPYLVPAVEAESGPYIARTAAAMQGL